MTINFTDRTSYIAWRQEWRIAYKELSDNIRAAKLEWKAQNRNYTTPATLWKAAATLAKLQRTAREMLATRAESKKIAAVQCFRKAPIQQACPDVVFHFNKKFLEDPTVPMWILKAKGQTFYVAHVTSFVPWSTKETPDNTHTKGSIKLKNVILNINERNEATITPA